MRGWEKSRRPLHSKHTSPLDKVAFVTAQHCLHLCIRYSKQRQQQSLIPGLSDLNFSLPSWVKLHSLTEKGNGPSLNQERWWEGGRMLSTTHNSSRFVLSNKRVFSWLTDFSPSLSPRICPAILGFWLTLVTLIGSDPDPDHDLQAYFPALPWPSPTQEPDALGSRLSLAAHRSPLSPAYPVPSLQVVGPGPGLWGHSPCQPKDPPYLPALTAHQQHGPSLLRKQLALIFLKQVKISEWVLISYPQVIKIHKPDDGQNTFPFNCRTPLALDYERFRIASFLDFIIWIQVICKIIYFKVDIITKLLAWIPLGAKSLHLFQNFALL